MPLTKQNQNIPPEKFFKSFSVYGTISTLARIDGTQVEEGTAIEIVPCKDADWVKKILQKKGPEATAVAELQHLSLNSWCMNAPKLRVYQDDTRVRTVKLEMTTCGYASSLSRFNLPLGAPQYKSDPASCDNAYSIPDITLMIYAVNKTVRPENYNDPIQLFIDSYATSYIHPNQGSHNLINLSRLHVSTDRSSIIPDIHTLKTIRPEPCQQFPFPLHPSQFPTAPFWTLEINPTNIVTSVKRKYVTAPEVLAQVGGLIFSLTQFFTLIYFCYNYCCRTEALIKNDILRDEKFLPEEYWVSGRFGGSKLRKICCCKRNYDTKELDEKREENFRACQDVLDQALDVGNFIRDSVEMRLLKGLFIKERHRALMPMLAVSTARRSLKVADDWKAGEWKIEGARKLKVSADEQPVQPAQPMDLDQAVGQLKLGLHKSDYEKMVDQFFLDNLPTSRYRQNRTEVSHASEELPRNSARVVETGQISPLPNTPNFLSDELQNIQIIAADTMKENTSSDTIPTGRVKPSAPILRVIAMKCHCKKFKRSKLASKVNTPEKDAGQTRYHEGRTVQGRKKFGLSVNTGPEPVKIAKCLKSESPPPNELPYDDLDDYADMWRM
jgi:hypothetical protein